MLACATGLFVPITVAIILVLRARGVCCAKHPHTVVDKQQPGSNAVGIEGEPNMGSGEPEPNLSNGDAHDVELNAASPMGMPAPLTPATDGAVEAAFDGFHAPPPTSKFSPSAEPVE